MLPPCSNHRKCEERAKGGGGMVTTAVVAVTKAEKLAALEAERLGILDLYRHGEPAAVSPGMTRRLQ